jgi:Membrane domain of glycerophosphoryl diester phosphodiesterase
MAIAATALPHFDMGRVVRRTFSAIGKNFAAFALLSLLSALTWTASVLAGDQFGADIEAGRFPGANTILVLAIWVLLYAASAMLLQGGVIHGAVASLNGKRASVANCLATGLKFLWPMFLIGLLETLGIVVGLVFLVVPGIILAVMWIGVGPACVVEQTGVSGAFSRSADLTRGYRWRIFGLYLAYVVAIIIAAVVVGFLIGIVIGLGVLALTRDPAAIQLATSMRATELVAGAINTMVSLIVGSAFSASVYYELREIKEGIGPEALASVFD